MSVTVMGHVWASDLPPHLKLVLLAYADHANDDGSSIYPGEEWMAAKTSYTKGTIRRNTKALLDDGYLEQIKRGYRGQRAEYRVNVPKVKASHIDTLSNASHLTTESLSSEAESLSSDDGMPSAHATPNVREPSEPSGNHHLATRNVAWDFYTHPDGFNLPAKTKAQQQRVGRLARELNAKIEHEEGMTDTLFDRASAWPAHFPDATMTPEAFEKHFTQLGRTPLRRSKREVEQATERQKAIAMIAAGPRPVSDAQRKAQARR